MNKATTIDEASSGKEVSDMPFGRGWFGWGGRGGGWGRGNPYPFCRNFPWLPRWWWATPNAGQYAATIPYMGYGYPYYGAGDYVAGASYYPARRHPWW